MSNFALPKHLIVLDVESSGVDTNESSIIQLGAVIFNKDGCLTNHEFNSYVVPYTSEWSEDAEKIHGIERGKLKKSGLPISKVLKQFEIWADGFCDGKIKNSFWLAQWGANFDVPMLKNAYKYAKRKFPFHYRVFDIASIVRFSLAKQGKLYKKCGENKCASALGIDFDITKLHDALYDTRLAGKMLEQLAKEGKCLT